MLRILRCAIDEYNNFSVHMDVCMNWPYDSVHSLQFFRRDLSLRLQIAERKNLFFGLVFILFFIFAGDYWSRPIKDQEVSMYMRVQLQLLFFYYMIMHQILAMK